MKLTQRTVAELLAAFQSSEPTPGGGSASALAGAVGASLLAMVAGLPKSRAATEEDAARLHAAAVRCRELSAHLAEMIDRDSESYDTVMAAYRMPKGTDAEKVARSTAIQDALRVATAAPLDVMRACAAAVEQGVIVARLGNKSAASDVQVGLELLTAGLRGAKQNVEINLGSIKDPAYIQRIRGEEQEFERHGTHEAAAACAALEA
jgi:formiminotetrahydrofolate cyclodeaminase